jgi:hypothetical protein
VYLYHKALVMDLLTTLQIASAATLGTAFSAAAIASLWLHMDFDWKLRRFPFQRRS